MKQWAIRLTCTGLFISGLLLCFILNPTFLYGNKTVYGSFNIYHSQPLDPEFKTILDDATALLQTSELYDRDFRMDICLNDGSCYATLIQALHTPAFGIGFYNKVVIMGDIHVKENYTKIYRFKYNLTQLIAHEALHCLQFHTLGLWKSNPVAGFPDWKWEGYNEYIARRNPDQTDLAKNIARFNAFELTPKNGWGIPYADSTYTAKEYYQWLTLMQYCGDVKKMTFREILQDTTGEDVVRREMMDWYNRH
jgi:hypothetical protein